MNQTCEDRCGQLRILRRGLAELESFKLLYIGIRKL